MTSNFLLNCSDRLIKYGEKQQYVTPMVRLTIFFYLLQE